MGGIIIFMIILIIFGIGLYFMYKKGYIPYTQPHLERYKKKVDEIVNELENKSENPGDNLEQDVRFLKNKFSKINNLFIFNTNLKEDTIARYFNTLSILVTRILNHHLADLNIDDICGGNQLDTSEIAAQYPGYYAFLNNTFQVINFFSRDNELYNACYHWSPEEPEEEDLINCYLNFQRQAPGLYICNPENFYGDFGS
jgi:hypothetical protein